MNPTLSRTAAATDVSERDAAWFEELAAGIVRGRAGLLARQQPDGHWVGELEGDTILESEYVLLLAFLGRLDDPRIPLAANYLLQHQQPGGGSANYPGGPAEISVSVKAYFALKIAGHAADEPYMRRAANVIRTLGGAEATQQLHPVLPRAARARCLTPRVRRCRRNSCCCRAGSTSTSTRCRLEAHHRRPAQRRLRAQAGHAACRTRWACASCSCAPPETPRWPAKPTTQWFSWTNFFLGVDWCFKKLERWRLTPLRRRAVRKAVNWMRERYADSDGLGAIFPPMIYTVDRAEVPRRAGRRPRDALGDEAARRPLHRRRRHAAASAVLLAGVGHRAVAHRRWPTPVCPDDAAGVRGGRAVAARQGSAPRRRLGEDRPRRRAGRLVLRVPQRLLPRHRRHRDGADRAGPERARDARRVPPARSTARSTGCSRCRTATAAGRRSTATSTARS